MGLRSRGVVRLHGALWETWGISGGFGARNVMILCLFYKDVSAAL